MKVITRPTVAVLLLLIALTTTTVAQQKRQTPAKPQPKPAALQSPAPTFDTLVPAEKYTMYGEVRGVGQLVRSSVLTDVLEPILKLAGPPKEFRTVVKWIRAHADDLMTSRLLVATWASDKNLPEAIIAIEFASTEEAAKFAGGLNAVLTSVMPPTAQPSPEGEGENTKAATPAKPSYHMQQTGSLILVTPTPLNLTKLRPAGTKFLTDEANFRAARTRFNSEPIFVFIDMKLIEKQEEERRKSYEQQQRIEEGQVKSELEAAAAEAKKKEEPTPEETEEAFVPEQHATLVAGVSPEQPKEAPTPDPVTLALGDIAASFFEGPSKWPDGIAFALSFENESFDLRALFVNEADEKSDTVPFVPMLIPGPPINPESPNILPADTQVFATMSLDLPQIYMTMSRPRQNKVFYTSRGNRQAVNEVSYEPPFAGLEKKLKMNLKDDLLPLLGSEITVRLPMTGLQQFGLPGGPSPEPVNDKQPAVGAGPVLLFSLRDKEGMRAMMPKIVESLGFKGASSLAQTERKEDTEIVSYLNLFSYAFIGNFLVISPDSATVRHVVDSYLKHETLASDPNYRNYTRWQPRPAHGQIYISSALMEGYKTWAEQTKQVSDSTREFLTRLTSVAQPITYSLSNEGFGPLHEVHIPKNLVLMAIAGISGVGNMPPERRNEGMAAGVMFMIAHGQEEYKKDKNKGAGSYGTLEQLIAAKLLPKEMIETSGYKFEMIVTGDKFEVFGVPVEYGQGGKMSYFIDQTRILRAADHNGASATSSDPPIN